ncbi:MAG: hypothetical protein NC416_07410 [Eubacterium sp.]|nr:hypothetical protein [Eubacterium sp.]
MSTLEKTISMMETLSESDLIKIQDLIRKLFWQHERERDNNVAGRIFKPMSREDILNDVEMAEEEIAEGKCRTAEEVFGGLEREYGF